MLTTREHRAVYRQTKDARNARARQRRNAPPQLIRVRDGERVLLVAVSRSAPGVGYLLRPLEDGRLACPCFGFSVRGRCAHVDAASPAVTVTHRDTTKGLSDVA